MKYKIVYTDSYNRRAVKFLKKHPDLIGQYEKTLKLLEIDPHHPSLRLHALTGKLQALSAVSINISYRITLEMIIVENTIIPVNVGHHSEVYRSSGK